MNTHSRWIIPKNKDLAYVTRADATGMQYGGEASQVTAMKPPSPQGISAALRKTGFERSKSEGRNGWSSGFEVSKNHETGAVHVRHYFSTATPSGRRKSVLDRYAKTLTKAGWSVEAVEDWELIVTSPKTEEQ